MLHKMNQLNTGIMTFDHTIEQEQHITAMGTSKVKDSFILVVKLFLQFHPLNWAPSHLDL